MKKRVFFAFFIVQILLFTEIASSQTICIVKSGDYPQYNEAIKGFWEIMISSGYSKGKSDLEYTLQKDNHDEIIQTIKNKKPNIIFTVGNSATKIFANSNIPVVFAMVLDPLKYKIIDSLENPGDNITGVTMDIPVKTQFNAMKEIIIKTRKVGAIYSADTADIVATARETAKNLQLELITQAIREGDEAISAFNRLRQSKIDILWLLPDATVLKGKNKEILLQKAKQDKIPVYGLTSAYLEGEYGAILSVCPDFVDIGRESAELTIEVLKGEKNISVRLPRRSIIYVKKNPKVQIPKGAIVVK